MKQQSSEKMPFVGSEFPDQEFDALREILLTECGLDLGKYKDRCLKRRIAAQIRRRGFHEAAPYVQLLRTSAPERQALLEALTIHVSQFFRNPSTFSLLEENILPQLIEAQREARRSELKIWSVGCAGGEEPYSLALLLDNLDCRGVRVTLLGTDLSDDIIAQAHQATYEPQRLADVPAEILKRYFVRDNQHYQLTKKIRDRVSFRQHNILGDDPYPTADCILCRNVMIYFSREEQENVFRRFAHALKPGGYLILGRAETLQGNTRRLFTVESATERIYRRTTAEAYEY